MKAARKAVARISPRLDPKPHLTGASIRAALVVDFSLGQAPMLPERLGRSTAREPARTPVFARGPSRREQPDAASGRGIRVHPVRILPPCRDRRVGVRHGDLSSTPGSSASSSAPENSPISNRSGRLKLEVCLIIAPWVLYRNILRTMRYSVK